MVNNKRWHWALFIAAIQFSVFVITIAMLMYNWSSLQQSQPLPNWWGLLALSICAIGIASIGLMMSLMFRMDKESKRTSLDLEQKIADKTSELNRTQNAIIFGLARLGESRDTDTGEHLDRVRHYVTILAEDLASRFSYFDEARIRNLGLASSLHDIGKVGLPDSILLKPGRLTEGERKVMEYHTVIGGECLEAIQNRLGENDFMDMARDIAWSHHERWDGSGYPHQLVGDAIPLVARIVAVADVYDALTSKRPYKHAMSHADSRKILLEGKGTQFDPMIIDAFIRHEEKFEAISAEQKFVSDEDCLSGFQRLADCVEALQSSSTNLLGKASSAVTAQST